jgi:hypothetical protein
MPSFSEAEVTGEAISWGDGGATIRHGATMIRLVKVVILRESMAVLGPGYNILERKEIFSAYRARAREFQQPRIDACLMESVFAFTR